MHGAHGKPRQITGKTQHLDLQWGEARRRACFIVLDRDGHHSAAPHAHWCYQWHRYAHSTGSSNDPPECRPTSGCFSPATSHALLLQTTDIPAETARLVRCHNPWPSEDVYFCPEDALPAFVTRVPTLSSGSEAWIAIHNHRPEPLRLHSGQNIGLP